MDIFRPEGNWNATLQWHGNINPAANQKQQTLRRRRTEWIPFNFMIF